MEQAEEAKTNLRNALKEVMSADYKPRTIVSEAAAPRTLDQFASDNPELRAIRDGIDELRNLVGRRQLIGPGMGTLADVQAMRELVEDLVQGIKFDVTRLEATPNTRTSAEFDGWIAGLAKQFKSYVELRNPRNNLQTQDDPWASDSSPSGFSAEPPF